MPTSDAETSPPLGAIPGLARILPFAGRDVYGLIAGMVISLVSSALALGIPIALEALVDGPLRGDDPSLVWPAVGLIAHRLSTVAIADRVLVIDGGRIVEDGPTAELLEGTGRFATLHRAWRDSLA